MVRNTNSSSINSSAVLVCTKMHLVNFWRSSLSFREGLGKEATEQVGKKTGEFIGNNSEHRANNDSLASAPGAQWDMQMGTIAEARLKELTSAMPVLFTRAVPVDRQETKNTYECPVYKTKARGPNYVWTFRLKSKEKVAKWVLAGVALLLEA